MKLVILGMEMVIRMGKVLETEVVMKVGKVLGTEVVMKVEMVLEVAMVILLCFPFLSTSVLFCVNDPGPLMISVDSSYFFLLCLPEDMMGVRV